MRTRVAMLTAGLAAVAALAVPTVAAAAPGTVDGITLAATPNPILSGQSMLIYGHLQGPNNAGQKIVLFHKVARQTQFTIIQRTKTDAAGNFEFLRPDGIVVTNRKWFVDGPNGTHSDTISEQVSALVSLSSSTANTLTGQQVVFTGHISPVSCHTHEQVVIQEQSGLTGKGWKTIAETFTNGNAGFSVGKAWRTPNDYTLRAVVKDDPCNIMSASDSLTETVQQAQNAAFTVNSSMPILPEGQAVTISGTLTSSGVPQVTLMAKLAGSGNDFQAIATANTSSAGTYTFSETPVFNTVYLVRATETPKLKSAPLFEGVQDQLTIGANAMTATVGGSVTVSGTVMPDKAGHLIILQELGTDGFWHDLQYGTVAPGSTYSFSVPFGQPGPTQLRAHISGGPTNIGNNSAPVTISVSGVAPVASLPQS